MLLWRARGQLYLYVGCVARTPDVIQVRFLLKSLFSTVSGLNIRGHYAALKILVLCFLVLYLSVGAWWEDI
jgi:hypothetical protein